MSSSADFPSALPADHVDALPNGTRLGEFEIQGLLGVGGFGMVYRAFDHSLRRPVAIKEYMPSALAGRQQGQQLSVRTHADEATFQAGLASFIDEARLLARFDHPSLVKVFRFWQENNTAYMVMPLYEGMTLKQARSYMRRPPSEDWLRKLLWSILDALRVLHDSNTLHRDISPDNIFLQDNGPPVLLDLGAARHAISEGEMQRQLTAILKVSYAPIEQYAPSADGEPGLPQGPWTDLYSLAAVIYGCLCNDAPLPATLRLIRDRMVRPARIAKTVRQQFGVEYSKRFIGAIAHALALQPAQRPQTIDAFLDALEMRSPPERWAQFDWRADLGSTWATAPESRQDLSATADLPTRFMDHATAMEVDFGATIFAPAPSASDAPAPPEPPPATSTPKAPAFVPERPAPAPARITPRPGRLRLWAGAGGGLLASALLAGAWWVAQPHSPAPELAPPVAAQVSAEALQAPPALTASDAIGPGEEVLEPQQDAEQTQAPPPSPAAAAAAASAPLAVARKASSAKAPAAPRPAASSTTASDAPSPPPAPKPAPAAAPARGPLEACADSNFLTRPMCLFNECQKPGLAQHPVCVQERKRYEEEEQRKRLLGHN